MNWLREILFVGLCVTAGYAEGQPSHKAQITARVCDDLGNPVSGIDVFVSTFSRHSPGEGFGRDERKTVTRKTDTNGLATMSIPCVVNFGNVSMDLVYGVASNAKLDSRFYQNLNNWPDNCIHFTNIVAGKWQPWNPTVELKVQRIVNPIPMYAKWRREGTIPAVGQPVGYDLMAGDWVTPYGKGSTPDFVFTLAKKTTGVVTSDGPYGREAWPLYDHSLTLAFTHDGDGIQVATATGKGLRLPRQAPEAGYRSLLVKHESLVATNNHMNDTGVARRSDFDLNANYFFRVRTLKDAQGNITNAFYGKIYNDFNAEGDGQFGQNQLTFNYYLNPTPNDRNMEFNIKSNLVENLPSLEQVTAP